MRTALGYAIISVALFLVREGGAVLTASDASVNYTEAVRTCTLFEPELKKLNGKLVTDTLIETTNTGDPFAEDAWIGYKRAYKIFQYIGCTSPPEDVIIAKSDNARSLVDCFYTCQKFGSVIGLTRDECFCFESTPNVNRFSHACSVPCVDPEFAVCGGTDAISLYEIVPDSLFKNVSRRSSSGDCLSLQPTTSNLKWTSCTTSLNIQCQDESANLVRTSRATTWNNAAAGCISKDRLPIDDKTFDVLAGSGLPQRWTGMFRVRVIQSRVGSTDNVAPDEEHLFISKPDRNQDDFVVLTTTDKSVKKKYICQTGLQTTTRAMKLATAGTTDYIGLYIGIIIALVAVTALVIITIVCLKKRKKESNKPAVPASAAVAIGRTDSTPVLEPDYTEVDLDLPQEAPVEQKINAAPSETYEYATVNKPGQNMPNTEISDNGSTYDVTNTHMRNEKEHGNNVYDHLNQPDTSNVYDTTNAKAAGVANGGFEYDTHDAIKKNAETDDADSTYDNTNHVTPASGGKDANHDLYDSTTNHDIYDKTGNDNKDVNDVIPDETYAHAQHTAPVQGAPDDFYI